MAHVKKFTHGAVENQIKHCKRLLENDSNGDIDPSRTPYNYTLTPEREVSEYEYYLQRKSELYCYNRSDIKTMAGWIVTAPEACKTEEEIKTFFQNVYNFLENRYGKENVVCAEVHFDEGKKESVKRFGELVRDENGKVVQVLKLGRPHLHFEFIPVTEEKKELHIKRGFKEKINASQVINRLELERFHDSLRKYLKANNVVGADGVITGRTNEQGGNRTVADMKAIYELEKEVERLREIERQYTMEHEVTVEKGRWE